VTQMLDSGSEGSGKTSIYTRGLETKVRGPTCVHDVLWLYPENRNRLHDDCTSWDPCETAHK
jgi:hypothetical protein